MKRSFVPLQVLGFEGIIQHFRKCPVLGFCSCTGALALKVLMQDLPPCLGIKNFTLVAKADLLKAVGSKLVIEGLNNHPGSSVSYLWFLDGS